MLHRDLAACALLLLASCGGGGAAAEPEADPDQLAQLDALIQEVTARKERNVGLITVEHILVAHKDAQVPGVTRTVEDAKHKAARLLAQIRGGADFGQLMREHSDDTGGGRYTMKNSGRPDLADGGAMDREGMVPAFGDVGWRLAAGEIGVAPYDPAKSRYGYHIIKRVQ